MAEDADDRRDTPTVVDGPRRSGHSDARPLSRGTLVGRYVVLDVLGAGGMGVVYAAYDPDLNRKVALKLMQAGPHGSTGGRGRMLREAQALARLSHPNVVAVYDVGSVGERVFLAMELVEGATLGAWRTTTKRTWREIVGVFAAAGRGLAAAHAAGIVHRDFKPSNVLVGEDGRVRVLDFGLARAADDTREDSGSGIASSPPHDALGESLTQAGSVLGTPVYMPPEAQRGEPVGPAGDQFSFCVALYEALYDRRPFDALYVGDELPAIAPAPAESKVPAWLRRVALRGLAFRPADRFASMAELLDALAADPARARRRFALAAAGALAVAGAIGGGVAWRAHERATARAADPCAIAAPLSGAWDDTVREHLRHLFHDRAVPDADAHFALTASALDEVGKRWLDAREQACADTRAARTQPEAVLLLRLSCLDRQRDELAALLALYEQAPPATLREMTRSIYRVPGPALCSDARSLSFFEPPPEAVRDRLAGLQARLLEARALKYAAKNREALRALEPLVGDARKVGYQPFVAQVLVEQCLTAVGGEEDDPVLPCDEAEQAAIASGSDVYAARAAAHRLSLGAIAGRDAAVMHDWEARARAWLARTSDRDAEDEVETGLGAMEMSAGRYDAAIAHWRRALALDLELGGESDVDAQVGRSNLALALAMLGRYDEAIVLQEKSIAALEHAFGRDADSLANILDNYGYNLVLVGRLRESRVALERAAKLGKGSDLGSTLCDLARVDLAEGKIDAAIAHCTDGIAQIRAVHVEKFNLAVNEDPLAAAYLAGKRYGDALAAARDCLAEFRKDRGDATIEQVPCMVVEGSALLELGRAAEAAGVLDEAARLQVGHNVPPGVRENLDKQLARARAARSPAHTIK